ncbi:protein of unknown function [Burkholderia multivorans]
MDLRDRKRVIASRGAFLYAFKFHLILGCDDALTPPVGRLSTGGFFFEGGGRHPAALRQDRRPR